MQCKPHDQHALHILLHLCTQADLSKLRMSRLMCAYVNLLVSANAWDIMGQKSM